MPQPSWRSAEAVRAPATGAPCAHGRQRRRPWMKRLSFVDVCRYQISPKAQLKIPSKGRKTTEISTSHRPHSRHWEHMLSSYTKVTKGSLCAESHQYSGQSLLKKRNSSGQVSRDPVLRPKLRRRLRVYARAASSCRNLACYVLRIVHQLQITQRVYIYIYVSYPHVYMYMCIDLYY